MKEAFSSFSFWVISRIGIFLGYFNSKFYMDQVVPYNYASDLEETVNTVSYTCTKDDTFCGSVQVYEESPTHPPLQ